MAGPGCAVGLEQNRAGHAHVYEVELDRGISWVGRQAVATYLTGRRFELCS